MDHDTILRRFLPHRLSRFVRQVYLETLAAMQSADYQMRKGYLKRDRVACKLVNRAYRRFNKTTSPQPG